MNVRTDKISKSIPTTAKGQERFALLVERVVQSQDRMAFGELFDHFAPRLNAYLMRLNLERSAAEELTQEVMIVLWQKAALYDPAKSSLSTWLFRIARNRRIDLKRRDRSGLLDPYDPVFQPEPEEQADVAMDNREREARVRAVMADLPPEQRVLITEAFFIGLSHSEIAEKNQLPLGTTTRPGALTPVNGVTNALRPYLGFSNVNFTEFGAIGNYNGLQARLSRRFARSFTANASYAWSKSMSEVDGDGTGLGYAFDRRREYGPAGYDRTHTLTFDYVYELPGFAKNNAMAKAIVNGWQLNGITRFATGNPATIGSNANPGTLGGGVRADYTGGDINVATKDRFNYFNIFAFARPQEGTLGNLGKNTLRLPGINQWDISLFKNTRITERVNVQLRIESFNTLNHTQWGGVNTGINAPNPGQALTEATRGATGQVTDTRDPRTLQMGIKLLF